jgi:hypothetical protein
MAIYRGLGGAGSNEQDASVSVITTKALEAATSATNAATSASSASTSATNAATSEANAASSASAAVISQATALASENNAATSESNASSSASSASDSATAAAASASAASTSETNAATSETNAATSAASALAIYGSTEALNAAVAAAAASESAAATSETNAGTSATNASNSASAASTSATNAATSETNAASSASSASTSATNAAASATAASGSASAAASSASAASASETAAAASETAAGASETAAAASETAASTSEANSATSETNAANSASAASASQSAAATSATNASNSASAASTSETNAAASASAASASEAAAAASFDAFDDRYLGSKTSDPSVDNDGNALLTGALYFDSVTGVMKVWSGSNWIAAYASLSGAMFGSNNLSDVASVSSSRNNLGLGTGDNVVFNQVETTNGLIVGGDLTVNGTTTTINATNLSVTDNMIYLNADSTVTDPDLGFAGNYNEGTYAHAGFFRDATDGYWKVFDGYTPEPNASPEINVGHASFTLADIQAANFRGALIGNASTATALQTARTIGLSGDVTGSTSFDGSGNATITAAVVDDSHSHSTSTITGLDAALASYAPLASPGLTGTPTAPTAAVGTNTTQVATTAFVEAQIANDAPTKTGSGASGTWNISVTGNAATATSATSATTSGSTTGNAATATKLATARTIGLSGDVSGSVSFDGSANATITAVVADDSHNHVISNVDGLQTALDGKAGTTGSGASGTWGISITGNAATATSATTAGSATTATSATTAGSATTATNATNLSTGTWTVTESGGVLYFKVSGVNKAKLDSSGNLTVVGNVTAYGSV